jgi:hypothetical protein
LISVRKRHRGKLAQACPTKIRPFGHRQFEYRSFELRTIELQTFWKLDVNVWKWGHGWWCLCESLLTPWFPECWVQIINNNIWDAYLFLLWELTYKQNIFINVIFINGNIIYLNEKFNLSVILRMILTHKMRMAISREVLPMRNLSWNVPSALTLSSTRPHSTCTPHSFTTEKRFL